jgi:hypothetical protein
MYMWSAVGEDEVRNMLARNDGIRCLIAALGDIAIQDVAVQSEPLPTDRAASRQACLASTSRSHLGSWPCP